ncbi:MAG: sensor histidine kinase [Candidatus Binatia bacterium]
MRRLSRYLVIYVVCAMVCLTATIELHAADGGRAKRVLIVSTGSTFASGFTLAAQTATDALRQLESDPLELYSESLDIVRFPSDSYSRLFRNYLGEKYLDYPPDLVLLIYVGNLALAEKLLEELFPGVPIVVVGLTEEKISPDQQGTHLTGLAQRSDPRATLELILRLQPETRRIVVIGGTAEVDTHVISRVREAARSWTGRAEFDFWTNRSMSETTQAVRSLPPQTAILFTRMFRDGAGQAFNSAQAVKLIAESANVPMYIMTGALLGSGAVGGSVADVAALARRAGELAHRVLSGAAPKSLPFEIRTDGVPMFDWQGLKRWGISESRLPPGSIVRNRTPSVWARYQWYIVGALIIMVIQAAMIADLLAQRARRRRAESKQRETQEIMELAASAGGLGLWMRDPKRGDFWANSQFRSLFAPSTNDALRFEDVVNRIHPDDRTRVAAEIERAEQIGLPYEGEFRAVLLDGRERWISVRGRNVNDAHGRGARRMGVVMDTTERKRGELEAAQQRAELAHIARMSTMGELAASLAHELNQPLTAILSNAQAAQRFLAIKPPDLDEVHDILQDIVQDNSRAGEVIRRMRALVKKEELAFASVDLGNVMGDVVLLTHSDAILHNVRIVLEFKSNLPRVWGDRVQLQQVLLNLLLNAFDAVKNSRAEERSVVLQAELDRMSMLKVAGV